ncbi:hypothetical protein SDRG_14794 [Saprolegnia diclina VS20]|uniref:TOG domain-containing protein n=1 Tax=Saprolegnia diclina (strain VS20) TaxID=1156394 RepID=T0PZ31_SAPDV|nr:hypothetical protein SDRG_14794 [Saprolegnia diclina VS20]EQC27471.1 hypothetical protein SDRG_14794 [Saprolegnia diclina VS20]|eukprot:XP_008619171.1 hypothetical protein SDRG_14794 [Saprolegnia diclina VS20]
MVNDAMNLAPYLDMIAPCLQMQLLELIPEVRTVVFKALGMLVKGLGQSHFPRLMPSLLQAIKSELSSVERSSSAKGLCEVLEHLGPDAPDLESLSNESDGVRDVAMHAGSIVVNAHALSNTKANLPALEAGIFDDNWRIRESSISLFGNLVYCVMPEVGPILRAGLDPMDPPACARATAWVLPRVLKVKSREVLPYLAPRLLTTPTALPTSKRSCPSRAQCCIATWTASANQHGPSLSITSDL